MRFMFSHLVGGILSLLMATIIGIMTTLREYVVPIVVLSIFLMIISFILGAMVVTIEKEDYDEELFELPFGIWFNKLLIKLRLRKEERVDWVVEESGCNEDGCYANIVHRPKVTNWKAKIEGKEK